MDCQSKGGRGQKSITEPYGDQVTGHDQKPSTHPLAINNDCCLTLG